MATAYAGANAAKEVGRGRSYKSLALSSSCHVQLIKLEPQKGENFGASLSYNIAFQADEKQLDLIPRKWALENWIPLASIKIDAKDELPHVNLCVGTNSLDLQLILSSCRRGGDEGVDAFHSLLSNRAASDAIWHFHANIMMGDQVYADDIDNWHFFLISQFAEIISNCAELIPADAARRSAIHSRKWSNISTQHREQLFRDHGFSSEKLANHCGSLGEFASLYCLAFASENLDKIFVHERRVELKKKYGNNANDSVETWLLGKAAIRRVWANTPTYFAIDDHEVSDDWNIDERWQIGGKPFRDKFVISNALNCFFAFQAWGNEPDNKQWHAKNFDQLQTQLIEYWKNTDAYQSPQGPLGWHWDYLTPTSPALVVLDTRTRRNFSGRSYKRRRYVADRHPTTGAPEYGWIKISDSWTSTVLIDDSGTEKMTELLGSTKKDPACFIVSPCVALGADYLRAAVGLINNFSLISREELRVKYDVEDWGSHIASQEALFEVIRGSGHRNCVFLSGDIHNSFIASGSVDYRGSRIRVCQVVASGSRNEYSASTKRFGAKIVQNRNTFEAYWIGAALVEETFSKSAFEHLKRDYAPDLLIDISKESTNGKSVIFDNNVSIVKIAQGGISCKILSKGGPVIEANWSF